MTANIIFIIMTVIAVSYSWGMRGDLIGGEEGAMLPGAMLGLCISAFLPTVVMQQTYFIFIALGTTGMFIGGTEPYAQTMDMLYWGDGFKKKPENLKKSIIGLAVKGSAWFGIAAAVIGIGFSAMTGSIYEWYEIAILVAAMPVMRIAGTRIINYPRDEKQKKFPRIYFSKTSHEEWGGLWFMLITLFAFILYHKDFFALWVLIAGVTGGSLGWIIAHLFNASTLVKMKNGKYFFGKFQKNGYIDNWKIMEFTLGALGSLAIALAFVLQKATVLKYCDEIISNGGIWSPLDNVFGFNLSKLAPIVFLSLFAIDALQHIIKRPEILRKKTLYSRYEKIKDLLHRPIICYLPMMLVLLGSVKTATLVAVPVLFWQAVEEFSFVQLNKAGVKNTLCAFLSYISTALLTVAVLIHSEWFTLTSITLLMGITYVILASVMFILNKRKQNGGLRKGLTKIVTQNTAFFSVKIYYVICITFTTILLEL